MRAESPGDDDDGEPFGEALDVPGGGESFADENPVHLGRQRVQAGQFRRARPVCLHKAAEQQPLAVADPCLHAALDLVVVEQALGLDVVLACRLALHAHHADDVFAAAGQALASAVGHVAELLDGLLHPDPGRIADPVLAMHDPGDRRGGDGSPAGDIVESDHGGSVGGVAVFGAGQDVSVSANLGGLTLALSTESVKTGRRECTNGRPRRHRAGSIGSMTAHCGRDRSDGYCWSRWAGPGGWARAGAVFWFVTHHGHGVRACDSCRRPCFAGPCAEAMRERGSSRRVLACRIIRLPICLRLFCAEQVGGTRAGGAQGGQDREQVGRGQGGGGQQDQREGLHHLGPGPTVKVR